MCAWPLPFALLRGRSRWRDFCESMKAFWWWATANKRRWAERAAIKREVHDACQTHSEATRQCIESTRRLHDALLKRHGTGT